MDLLQESPLGIVAQIELFAKRMYNKARVIIFKHFYLLKVMAIQLNFEHTDWLLHRWKSIFKVFRVPLFWHHELRRLGQELLKARVFFTVLLGSANLHFGRDFAILGQRRALVERNSLSYPVILHLRLLLFQHCCPWTVFIGRWPSLVRFVQDLRFILVLLFFLIKNLLNLLGFPLVEQHVFPIY